MEIVRPASRQPMPDDATKVFSGVLFDVYQWEVMGYDGKPKTFEKVKRSDTAMIIAVTEEGQIIVALQEQPNKAPFMGLVGGRLDEGEEPLEAAKRELLEETGYEAAEWQLFDAVQPVGKIDWAIYTFIARGCKKVAEQNLDGAEKIDLKLVDFDEFVQIVMQPNFGDLELRIKLLEAQGDPQKMAGIKDLIVG